MAWNIWVQLAIVAISAILNVALSKKAQSSIKPAILEDFNVPTAEEGREIPVIFGTVKISDPNVVWYGDLRTLPIKKSGGKK